LDSSFITLTIIAYLVGSIPFGLLFTRLFTGMNLRNVGSGNIGATNALRAGGKLLGLLTLLADLAKGAIPVFIAVQLYEGHDMMVALVSAAAFFGHIFPVYLGFRGGKGVATLFGVTLPWLFWVAVTGFMVWLIVLLASRYVSIASMAAAMAFPIAAWMLDSGIIASITMAIFALTVLIRHESNIRHLLKGSEPKIGQHG
jgi:glycerol-3-phosphate acyltransferase PlsY